MANKLPLTLALALCGSLSHAAPAAKPEVVATHAFTLAAPAEVLVSMEAGCEGCNWARTGHEAAVLTVRLDGEYSQHLVLAKGEGSWPYHIALGALPAGAHKLAFEMDRSWTPQGVRVAQVKKIEIDKVTPSDKRYPFVSHSPILCARPNTIRKFTDTPLVEWVETDTLAAGRRFRYSVIFSNEDGGTPADRLLATWGRLTDIEYIYSVDFDAAFKPVLAEFQGKDHIVRTFAGKLEANHPLIHVVTDNNMVSDEGTCEVRFTLPPKPVDLAATSRESVMDDEPWSYRVSSEEARREGRVVEGSKPGDKTILDPTRYVYIEACAPTQDTGITFALGVQTPTGVVFRQSDGGNGIFLILREASNFPNGCFRGAVSLPPGVGADSLRAIRFMAHTRPTRKDETPLPKGSGSAHLVHVNQIFMPGPGDVPGKNLFKWTGDLKMIPDGPAVEVKIGG